MAESQDPKPRNLVFTMVGLALLVVCLVLAIGWGCASASHRKLPGATSQAQRI